MNPNSLEAFQRLRASGVLNSMREKVLGLIVEYPDLTASELADNLQVNVRSIAPRIHELHLAEIIVCSGQRECRVTQYTANIWAFNPDCKIVRSPFASKSETKNQKIERLESRIDELERRLSFYQKPKQQEMFA